jgi:hypothetical protein
MYFSPNEVKAGGSSTLHILIDKNRKMHLIPIKIQGIGEDGKIRNMTIYLSAS